MNPVNVALIGVTGYAHCHYLEVLRWHGEGRIRLVAATVINAAEVPECVEALRQISCQVFADYREMLARCWAQIDLVIVPTGIHLHVEMTLAAFAAGCHVLLEKPVAATIQEVRELEAAVARYGKLLAIGFQHLYAPEVAEMKRLILDGTLGEVRCIKTMGLWPRPKSYYHRNNWAGRLKTEGRWVLDSPFTNAFAHWLNLLCFLAGTRAESSSAPHSVCAELYRAYSIETTDTACLRLEAATGIPLYFWASHACASRVDPVLEVRGEKASLVMNERELLLRKDGCETRLMAVNTPDQLRTIMYEAVIDRVAGGKSFICDLAVARNQIVAVDGAFEAATIRSIPEAFLETDPRDGDPQICVRGMADIFQTAFCEEKLLSEMGVEWAAPGKFADLRGYTEFRGGP